MPHVLLLRLDEFESVRIAGRSLREHWASVVRTAGLRLPPEPDAIPAGPRIELDAGFPAVSPARLRELAATLADGPGATLASDAAGTIAVARTAGEDGEGAAERPAADAPRWTATEVEACSADDPWELGLAERAVVDRVLRRLSAVGVRLVDPSRIWVEPRVRVARGVTLWPGTTLLGSTRLGADVVVHPGVWLRDTVVGAGTVLKPHTTCDGATIGADCAIGPMAHLRPGAILEDDVKVGNFVEVKKARLRRGVRASHLSYLGDADVGEGANIGAGTITCNYDGFGKHKTEIGAGAFIGSNTALVAPIQIGDGAIVAAGSTVTRNVSEESLVVERAEEKVLEGKAPRIRERNRRRAEKAREESRDG